MICLVVCGTACVLHERHIVMICNGYPLKTTLPTGLNELCGIGTTIGVVNSICAGPIPVARAVYLQIAPEEMGTLVGHTAALSILSRLSTCQAPVLAFAAFSGL
jgi:hypothetical protein